MSAAVALALYAIYLLLAFGLRTWLQVRRTGSTGFHVAGVLLATAGIAATLAAQLAMGTSWRIGVDPEERTDLVTTGPFALVRNPIFAVRVVEEPYLRTVHGDRYLAYARATGRFVPGIGRRTTTR